MDPGFLGYVLIGLVCITIFLVMNPHYLHGKTNRNYTPFLQKRFARHPNGLVSTIQYDYEDVNDKKWWKFNEWDLEVQASEPEDVIKEPGAEYGNGFYVFRFNRDGSKTEWNNPHYKEYFANHTEKLKQTETETKTELKKQNTKSGKFLAGDAEESKRTDAKYVDAQIHKLELEGLLALSRLGKKTKRLVNPEKETEGEELGGE